MDGDEQIRRHAVGFDRALDQTFRRRRGGNQQYRAAEAGIGKRLFDVLTKLQIEGVFGNAAGADGARHSDGMADIDDDTEGRALTAGGRLCRGGRMALAACRIAAGADGQRREDGGDGNSSVAWPNHRRLYG